MRYNSSFHLKKIGYAILKIMFPFVFVCFLLVLFREKCTRSQIGQGCLRVAETDY